MSEPDGDPVLRLERFEDDGAPRGDDGFADLRADVAAHAHLDPLVTLRALSDASGIPVGALARYVLTRWAAGGSEGVLELGVSGVDHLVRIVSDAEVAGTDAARIDAYQAIRGVVGWLRAGLDEQDAGDPGRA